LKFDQLGRPLDAERMYRRAIDISRDGKTDDAVSPMLLANYVRRLRAKPEKIIVDVYAATPSS